MSETNINVTPGSGGPNIDLFTVDNGNARQAVVIGDATTATKFAPVDSVKGLTTIAYQIPADQCVTGQGASAAALTITLPAVASMFHYIVSIRITALTSVAPTANGTPVNVTTTNLPGSLAWLFGNAPTLGNTQEKYESPAAPIKSNVAGTPTTIVCPVVASLLWRVNVYYYTAS